VTCDMMSCIYPDLMTPGHVVTTAQPLSQNDNQKCSQTHYFKQLVFIIYIVYGNTVSESICITRVTFVFLLHMRLLLNV